MDFLLKKILKAISKRDIDAMEEFIQYADDSILTDDTLISAVLSSGNTKIVRTYVEMVDCDEDLLESLDLLKRIPLQNCGEVQKLQVVKYLLRYYSEEHPERPGYYPIDQIFEMVVACCLCQNFFLSKFFISTFYSEKYNSLYPLIQKLEAAVDGSHYICVLLHDEIDYLEEMSDLLIGGTFESLGLRARDHVGRIVETFIKLLLKNTQESMQLAVETFRVLIDKGFNEYSIACYIATLFDLNKNETLENPLLMKLAFQFIYHSINDANRCKIYNLMAMWYDDCPRDLEIFQQVNSLLVPFLMKPSPDNELLDDIAVDHLGILGPVKNGQVGTLKELCRDVVRSKVAKNVETVKTFMDRIWSLHLPVTLKCFLLYIPDASWMSE